MTSKQKANCRSFSCIHDAGQILDKESAKTQRVVGLPAKTGLLN